MKTWTTLSMAAGCALVAASACGAPAPVEAFTRLPAMTQVLPSPSGDRLAMTVAMADGHLKLAVMDLEPAIGAIRIVAGYGNADIANVHWVNDKRLVFTAAPQAYYVRADSVGTIAVDIDGSSQRVLIGDLPKFGHLVELSPKLLPHDWWLVGAVGDGSDDVMVKRWIYDNAGAARDMQLARLDTRTGVLRPLSRRGMPEHVVETHLDDRYEPRFVATESDGREKVFWRRGDGDDWTEVADFDAYRERPFSIWHIDVDAQVYVVAQTPGHDARSIHRFDPATRRVDPQPVLALDGFDLQPRPVIDARTHRMVGVDYVSDRHRSVWFDAGLRSVQRGVDAALPGRDNRLICANCESGRWIVVRSESDRQPGEYFLFDRSKSSMQRVGSERPWIDEAAQGRRTFHRFTARDGLSVPVYVTHPAGHPQAERLPAVVLVHGGPWVRGSDIEWKYEAQFLASRGYRVIEPEFRGSTGYGWALYHAGWRQWGLAMEDDLVDAVEWADAQGLVDPRRVCIMGASYGGYAALMGPIASPGTWRCAVSLAGVTDIDLMYGAQWSDAPDEYKHFGMPVLIGDRTQDARQLANTSPVRRAGEIRVPLLVGHGGLDRRVPVAHESAFVGAARKAGVKVEEAIYPDEGHGLSEAPDRVDFFSRVERFLASNLGADAAPAAAPAVN